MKILHGIFCILIIGGVLQGTSLYADCGEITKVTYYYQDKNTQQNTPYERNLPHDKHVPCSGFNCKPWAEQAGKAREWIEGQGRRDLEKEKSIGRPGDRLQYNYWKASNGKSGNIFEHCSL